MCCRKFSPVLADLTLKHADRHADPLPIHSQHARASPVRHTTQTLEHDPVPPATPVSHHNPTPEARSGPAGHDRLAFPSPQYLINPPAYVPASVTTTPGGTPSA